jgi:hypothetical protein
MLKSNRLKTHRRHHLGEVQEKPSIETIVVPSQPEARKKPLP